MRFATKRCNCVSRAFQTSAMPPRPRRSRNNTGAGEDFTERLAAIGSDDDLDEGSAGDDERDGDEDDAVADSDDSDDEGADSESDSESDDDDGRDEEQKLRDRPHPKLLVVISGPLTSHRKIGPYSRSFRRDISVIISTASC